MSAAIRVGLIGAGGNMRIRHVPGFRAIDGVDLVSLVNRTPESSERAAREYGVPHIAVSPEALIADPSVDAVCIGTWPYRHMEYTVAALEAGKHVLCEARMAMDLDESLTMQRAHEAHPGLVAQLVPAPFDFRLGPTITRLIREGAIGEVVEATVTVLNGSGLDRAAPLHWRQMSRYSGRNIMSLGIYIEIVERWLGRHSSVAADGQVAVPLRFDPETGGQAAADVPDTFSLLARLASGARVSYHFSTVTGSAPPAGISVYGTTGAIHWTMGDHAQVVAHGGAAQEVTPDAGTDRGWRVESDFIESIRLGTPVRLTNFADGVSYMLVMDAAWRSWQEGRRISVEG